MIFTTFHLDYLKNFYLDEDKAKYIKEIMKFIKKYYEKICRKYDKYKQKNKEKCDKNIKIGKFRYPYKVKDGKTIMEFLLGGVLSLIKEETKE